MFKAKLKEQLTRILDLDKVSFDLPGESQEQEAVFIEVQSAKTRLRDGVQIALVRGTIHIFANSDKLPYGYASKRLAEARPEDTKKLFFFNFEENKGTFRNIVERSIDFLYLFESQFDPAVGELTSIDLSIAETS